MKNTIYFDVDDTLVFWISNPSEQVEAKIVYAGSNRICLLPNRAMIEKLKEHSMAGDVIVVWSQGGSDWVREVIQALNLDPYVHFMLGKPTLCYDDLPTTYWLPTPLYARDK